MIAHRYEAGMIVTRPNRPDGGTDYIDAFAVTRSVSAMTSTSLEPHRV